MVTFVVCIQQSIDIAVPLFVNFKMIFFKIYLKAFFKIILQQIYAF